MILSHKDVMRFFCSLFIAVSLVGCASVPKNGSKVGAEVRPTEQEIDIISERSQRDFKGLEKQFDEIEESLKDEDLKPGEHVSRPESVEADAAEDSIRLEFNSHVKKWIRYFAVRSKERFQRYLDRGEKYRDVVEQVLRQHGLPPELYYLAMIESGYATHARSHMAAVGTWQFIPGTGRRYGLDLNRYVDERRDPIRATEAAARYLTDLFNVFNSWYLAMAAYNAGEGRVLGAIMRGNSRDFWELVRKKKLPSETRNYVPKFIAATIIGRNPERFGFRTPKAEPYPDVTAIELPSPVRLSAISKASGMPLDALKKVNPHLRQGVTPPNKRTYDVWIPNQYAAQVRAAEAQLGGARLAKLSTRSFRSRGTNPNYHQVRRGESLFTIAQKYRITVSELKRINSIRGNRIMAGSRLRIASSGYQRSRSGIHRVRKGENLSTISRKYGMSISQVRRLNRLSSNRIYVGQSLRVYGKNTTRSAAIARRPSRKSARVLSRGASYHTVRPGENLGLIARRYGSSPEAIQKLNDLSSSIIQPGMRLRVSGVRSAAKSENRQYHVVRKGENLFRIAKKYGQSVNKLMRLNGMKSKIIHPGTRLIIASR